MSPTMLLILAAAAAVGLVLVLLGWRGKRINDHPICRGCGFDLIGVLPAGVTCPECGAGLKRDKAIRKGQRRRRWAAVAVGAVLVLLPALTGGTLAYALITGTDLNRYKPIGLLQWELRNSAPETADAAALELKRRYSDGELGDDEKASLIQLILGTQRDPRAHWNDALGDVVEAAHIARELSDETYQRFLEDAAVLDYRVRESIGAGELIPVVADLVESRLGGAGRAMGQYWVRTATIDGRAAKVQSGLAFGPGGPEPNMIERDAQIGWVHLYDQGGWGPQPDGSCNVAFLVQPTDGLEPGPHTLELNLLVKVVQQTGGMMGWSAPPRAEDPEGFRRSKVTLSFRTAADPIGRIAPTPELDEDVAASLSVTHTGASRSFTTTHAWLQITVTDPPVDFAFDATLRQGERKWPFGEVTSGRLATQTGGWGNTAFLQAEAKGLTTGPAEIILTPSETVARRTIDLTRMYDGEIVIEDVEIRPQGNGFGSFLRGIFGG